MDLTTYEILSHPCYPDAVCVLFECVVAVIEFFLNYQQHKNDRSGNYVFPYFLFVKFITDTRKSCGICYYNFLLIIGIKRTDISINEQENNI